MSGSLIINQLITDGFLMDHVKMLRSVFIERIDAMCAALDTHMPGKDACLRALSVFVFTSSNQLCAHWHRLHVFEAEGWLLHVG